MHVSTPIEFNEEWVFVDKNLIINENLSTKWEKVVKCGIFFNIFDSYIQIIMNSLNGTYECKVDAKGRLMLPAALKKQLLPILQNGFVLKRSVFQTFFLLPLVPPFLIPEPYYG